MENTVIKIIDLQRRKHGERLQPTFEFAAYLKALGSVQALTLNDQHRCVQRTLIVSHTAMM